ncbi:hypothetical protein EDB85DRAFT_670318 [Lactarius pseudohatsudake]|nr:hypothetical protein EDB85DRAFT_670318 [Lactarius pseudohatsudake]
MTSIWHHLAKSGALCCRYILVLCCHLALGVEVLREVLANLRTLTRAQAMAVLSLGGKGDWGISLLYCTASGCQSG